MAEMGIFFAYGKRLRQKLKKASAVSEEAAKTIEELDLSNREIRTLKRNVMIGKVKEIIDEKGKNDTMSPNRRSLNNPSYPLVSTP